MKPAVHHAALLLWTNSAHFWPLRTNIFIVWVFYLNLGALAFLLAVFSLGGAAMIWYLEILNFASATGPIEIWRALFLFLVYEELD